MTMKIDSCIHCTQNAGLLPEGTAYYDAPLHYWPDIDVNGTPWEYCK